LSINSFAQDFYLLGGTNISTLSKTKNDNLNRTKQLGFQIGAVMDINLLNNLLFSPQVSIVNRREKNNEEGVMVVYPENIQDQQFLEVFSQVNNYYIDIPLAFKYNFSFKSIDIYPYIGPYVSLLVFNDSSADVYLDHVFHEKIESDFPKEFIDKVDYGLNIGLGTNYKSFLINLGVDLGMYRKVLNGNAQIKNTVLKVSLGYKI
jgi:hypothetical protein